MAFDNFIHLSYPLVLLEHLESGNLSFSYQELDKIDQQLDCFSFSSSIVDIIAISSLEAMYQDETVYAPYQNSRFITESVLSMTLQKAECGSKIYQKVRRG